MTGGRRMAMELTIRCERCNRDLKPAWVMWPKENKVVGMVSGYCQCGKISDAWAGVTDLAAVYGKEAVIQAAERLAK
jgi:hypothetical protein